MKLGARILKTGIAITLALYLASLLNLPSPVFAGIAATFAMQPSIYKSYQSVIEQLQANFIGAFLAIIFVLTLGNDPFIVGLASIIVILINLRLKIENTIPIALVTVIAIMESPEEAFIQFSLIRFSTIMLGIFSSFLVNLLFIPPKHEDKLYSTMTKNVKEIQQWIRIITSNKTDQTALNAELDQIKEATNQVEQLYLLFKEERSYLSFTKQLKKRKLVVFRQMILAMNTCYRTLKNLDRYENEIHHLPDSMHPSFKSLLDGLISYHEQILFLYEKKVRSDSLYNVEQLDSLKEEVTKAYIQFSNHKDHTNTHLLIIIASLIEYCDHLKHLHKLIDNFQSHHQDEEHSS